MTEKEKTPPPTYLSVTKIDKLVEMLQNKNYPKYNSEIFKNQGFGVADAFLAFATLRFLGLVDREGVPNTQAKSLQLKADKGVKAMEAVVRSAYSRLFEVTADAHLLPEHELTNDFLSVYALSPRVARGVVPAFLRLCEYAGMKEMKHRASPREKDNKSVARRSPLQHEDSKYPKKVHSTIDSSVLISIPIDTDDRYVLTIPTDVIAKAAIDGSLSTIMKSLEEFVQKFKTNKPG